MKDALLSLLVLVAILLAAALVTNWFARAMYKHCAACGTLNARRRAQCRNCGQEFT